MITTAVLAWCDRSILITSSCTIVAGVGGRPGSIWQVNQLGLFAAVQSHDTPPAGPWYDLKAGTDGFFVQWADAEGKIYRVDPKFTS
jgi:hypothetical protein